MEEQDIEGVETQLWSKKSLYDRTPAIKVKKDGSIIFNTKLVKNYGLGKNKYCYIIQLDDRDRGTKIGFIFTKTKNKKWQKGTNPFLPKPLNYSALKISSNIKTQTIQEGFYEEIHEVSKKPYGKILYIYTNIKK